MRTKAPQKKELKERKLPTINLSDLHATSRHGVPTRPGPEGPSATPDGLSVGERGSARSPVSGGSEPSTEGEPVSCGSPLDAAELGAFDDSWPTW